MCLKASSTVGNGYQSLHDSFLLELLHEERHHQNYIIQAAECKMQSAAAHQTRNAFVSSSPFQYAAQRQRQACGYFSCLEYRQNYHQSNLKLVNAKPKVQFPNYGKQPILQKQEFYTYELVPKNPLFLNCSLIFFCKIKHSFVFRPFGNNHDRSV